MRWSAPVVALAMVAAGCGEPPWAAPPAPTGLVDGALAASPRQPGAATWQRHCAICHGASGAGDGFNASLLAVPPPTAAVLAARGEGLAAAIGEGSAARGASPLCPPWAGVLDRTEVAEVVEHVRRLADPAR
ncbi:MAG: hypothetical protein AMXMBFR64_62270 [Myxococcales bacterium]